MGKLNLQISKKWEEKFSGHICFSRVGVIEISSKSVGETKVLIKTKKNKNLKKKNLYLKALRAAEATRTERAKILKKSEGRKVSQ